MTRSSLIRFFFSVTIALAFLTACGGGTGKKAIHKNDSQALLEDIQLTQASLPIMLSNGNSVTAMDYDAGANLVTCEFLVPGAEPMSEEDRQISHQAFCGSILGFFNERQEELFRAVRPDIRFVIRNREEIILDDTLRHEEYL